MQKRINIKILFFKALLVAVFGAFFFVQTQAEFIYCAYNNGFPSSHHTGAGIGKSKPFDATGINLKFNKSYQAVSPNAIIPADVTVPVYFTLLRTNWYIQSTLTHAYFLYSKPLRGPPTV